MQRSFSYSLVAAQFSLSASLVLTTRVAPFCFGCLTLAVIGGALAVWAWWVMGLRRMNISPHVRHDVQLVTAMPYRVLRHPMYTGLLLFCGGLTLTDDSRWRIVVWILLAIVLDLKARLEERLLLKRFPEYSDYCRTTWRLVPFLY